MADVQEEEAAPRSISRASSSLSPVPSSYHDEPQHSASPPPTPAPSQTQPASSEAPSEHPVTEQVWTEFVEEYGEYFGKKNSNRPGYDLQKEKEDLRTIVRKWSTGCSWDSMAGTVPHWDTVAKKSRRWQKDGLLQWLVEKGVLAELPKTQTRKRKRKDGVKGEEEEEEEEEDARPHKK
jgi:hypothetical protein